MRISDNAGLITAGRQGKDKPLEQVGTISCVKRSVLTMRQAGLFPIVVVTGPQADEVRSDLSNLGVIFLEADTDNLDQFSLVRLGLEFLQDKCARVCYAPVNVPLFRADTIDELISTGADVANPVYDGVSGHPVVFANNAIPFLLTYEGEDGLRGALHSYDGMRTWIAVEDPGVCLNVWSDVELDEYAASHTRSLVSPHVALTLASEHMFFDARTKLLLFLLDHTNNMRKAALMMGLSYSKAWVLVNDLEATLGITVVDRRHGGLQGGRTNVTDEGRELLVAYQAYEHKLCSMAQTLYDDSLGKLIRAYDEPSV